MHKGSICFLSLQFLCIFAIIILSQAKHATEAVNEALTLDPWAVRIINPECRVQYSKDDLDEYRFPYAIYHNYGMCQY